MNCEWKAELVRWTAGLVVLAVALLLIACGDDASPSPASVAPKVEPWRLDWVDATDPATGRAFRCLYKQDYYGAAVWCYEVTP